MNDNKLDILINISEISKELYELTQKCSEISDTIYELERDVYKGTRKHILPDTSTYVSKQVNLNYLKDMLNSIQAEIINLEDELFKEINEKYKIKNKK